MMVKKTKAEKKEAKKSFLKRPLVSKRILKKEERVVVVVRQPKEIPEDKQLFFMGKQLNSESNFLFS